MDGAIIETYDSLTNHADLLEGYRQMANDAEQEAEASEWMEALIGDAIPDEE